jgi:hypothetical protein
LIPSIGKGKEIRVKSGWMWWPIPLIPASERQRQVDLHIYVFEASLVYPARSRTPRAIE